MSKQDLLSYHYKVSNRFYQKLTALYFAILIVFAITILTLNSRDNNLVKINLSYDFFSKQENIANNTNEEENATNEVYSNSIDVQKGDSLYKILSKQNIAPQEIKSIIHATSPFKLHSKLQIGKTMTFDYEISLKENEESELSTEERALKQITYQIDKIKKIEITKNDQGLFVAREINVPLNKVLVKYDTKIKDSFTNAVKKFDISTNNIIELINAYSHTVDFQRHIRSGDTITIMAEKYYTEQGDFSHHGKIIFASLTLSGKEHQIYNYSSNEKSNQFYAADGSSTQRSLLRTPLKSFRISSHFGPRKHPVLGYNRMHKGVDFAAPTGTPIRAAGDGVIQEIGMKGAYGNFVLVKHNNTYSTAYAHASRFAKNLHPGSRVKQGQIIAYVGKTGRATGAHLHYEVRVNGVQVNPMRIKTTTGSKLAGNQLKQFAEFKKQIHQINNQMPHKQEIAFEKLNFSMAQ